MVVIKRRIGPLCAGVFFNWSTSVTGQYRSVISLAKQFVLLPRDRPHRAQRSSAPLALNQNVAALLKGVSLPLVQLFKEFWALMQMLGHSFIGHRKFQHFLIGSHGPHKLYAHRTPVFIESCRQGDDWEPG